MPGILQRFKAQHPPASTSPEAWKGQQQQKLESIKDNQDYIEQSLMNAAFQQKDAAKKPLCWCVLRTCSPDSPNAGQAWARRLSRTSRRRIARNDRKREQRAGKRPGQ